MSDEAAWWRPAVAEFVGVFALVFIGAGSIITFAQFAPSDAGAAARVGIALAHGLTIAVFVTALGHISGAHFNPAVTVAALFTRRIKTDLGIIYVTSQLLGGLAGAYMLIATLPEPWWEPVALGTPALADGVSTAKGLLMEAVLTFFLVFVIFGAAMDDRNKMSATAGLAIGLTITVDILIGGPVTGAAMNPARAFGPALASQNWANHFVWWIGPLLGGILAGLVYDTAYLEPRRRQEGDAKPADETTPSA